MRTLDCTNLKCPLPLLRLKMFINENCETSPIKLITTDQISTRDIPAFCIRAGHDLKSVSDGPPYEFIINLVKT
ncbi:MAG TPA: hypothetical protein DEF72_05405 [Gammaproteobacteria bacterium]|nr:response regulator SirA [Gammaproteobacteria bacterium]HBX26855.1 hypothetical protein [Gammaproteobacteria bacterium]